MNRAPTDVSGMGDWKLCRWVGVGNLWGGSDSHAWARRAGRARPLRETIEETERGHDESCPYKGGASGREILAVDESGLHQEINHSAGHQAQVEGANSGYGENDVDRQGEG